MRVLLNAVVNLGSIVLIVLATSCSRQVKTQSIEFADYVAALTNLNHFAETPLGTPHLISSFDRTGGNSDWDNMSVPDKDGLYPVAMLQGPGCIKRLWHTNIPGDRWFFFFDGESVARLSLTREELFGGVEPFTPPLADAVSSGYYCYVPIMFEKSLRIAISSQKGTTGFKAYYQINYESYDDSIHVTSFPKQLTEDDTKRVSRVRDVWNNTAASSRRAIESCRSTGSQVLEPNASSTWLKHTDGGILRTFWFQWKDPDGTSYMDREKRLRQLTLRMYWDGAKEPSVDVPLGDFFCNALNRRRFSSLPVSVLDDAMVCRFPMPFKRSVRAELHNDGTTPVTVSWGYDVEPPEGSKGNLNYFHARWNSSTVSGRPYSALTTQGKGHYVGCYMVSIGTDGSWNILESDESMFLNGETVPSMNGTGLEDYFNGAWYYNGLFDFPFHGLLDKAAMRTAQYRFHMTDPVAFQDGFRLDWEFGHGNSSRGYFSSVVYWYQNKPHPSGTKMPRIMARYPPNDKFEPASIMTGLFELERIGLHKEAAVRCEAFAEKYARASFAPMLRLRSAVNLEFSDGFDSVKETYASIAKILPESDTSQQAKMLLWYHGSPSNALLAAHSDMRINFYIDGQLAGKGANPSAIDPIVAPVVLVPGAHEITAEVTPICRSPWVSFCLRTHTTNIISDTTWEYTLSRPADWPSSDDESVTWTNVYYAKGGLPKMGWWQFKPNAFVNLQGGNQLIEPAWQGWGTPPFKTTYLRKEFVVP